MKKILIIEDDGDTLELLGIIAEESNLEVVLHSNVLPLEEIEKINPDFILLDHWIGAKFGSDLCRQLKGYPPTQDIPIVILSANQDLGQIAFDNLADGCLGKPFDIEELVEVFDTYLGK